VSRLDSATFGDYLVKSPNHRLRMQKNKLPDFVDQE